MPNWKKVIVSGSSPHFNNITASGAITASEFLGPGQVIVSGSSTVGGSIDIINSFKTLNFIGNAVSLVTSAPNTNKLVTVQISTGSSTAFPFTGDAQITGSLLISGSKIHLRGESASPGPILELESLGGGSGKDVFIKVGDSNENYAYVLGADDTGNSFRISSGTYSGATLGANDKFIIDGNNIEFPAGNISGSAISTASFGHYLGDGSQLTNLPPSNPFPFTGDAQITGSLIVSSSGITSIGNITASNKVLIGSELNIGQSPYNGQYKGNLNLFDSNSKPTFQLKHNLNTVQNTANMTMYAGLNNPGVFLVAGSSRLNYIGGGLSIGNGNTMDTTNSNTTGDAKLYVVGNAQISGSVNISGSGGLSVESSGSTVFEVIGSEGTLFSVDDDLDGTIFTVNDRSGLPVLEASASGEVYIGKSPQSLYTTAVISSTTADISQSIYGLSTSSYGGVFVDYTANSGSNARAGSIMSVWSGSSINFTETTTLDIGDTSNLLMQVAISQSQAQVQSYATTAGYNIKTIIKAI